MSVSRETKKFINVIYLLCARLFQICTCVLVTMALISVTELKKRDVFQQIQLGFKGRSMLARS